MGLFEWESIPRGTAVVRIRGVQQVVTDVPADLANRLSRAFPPPVAPLGPDPQKGSLAPWIERHDDHVFRTRLLERRVRIRAAEIAVGIGWKDTQGRGLREVPENQTLDWCESAREFIEASLDDGEVMRLSEAIDTLADAEGGRGMDPGKG